MDHGVFGLMWSVLWGGTVDHEVFGLMWLIALSRDCTPYYFNIIKIKTDKNNELNSSLQLKMLTFIVRENHRLHKFFRL